jgi:hypothetical protein
VSHTFGKLSMNITIFLQTSTQLEVYTRSYRSPKLWKSQFREFQDSQLGSPRTKWHLHLGMWQGIENIIRGEVVASPKSRSWWSCEVVSAHGSSMHQKCSNYALTNLLFVLYRSMWISDPLVVHPSPHPGTPAHPSTFEVLWIREHTPTHYPSVVFTFEFIVESIKEFGGVSKSG